MMGTITPEQKPTTTTMQGFQRNLTWGINWLGYRANKPRVDSHG